MSKEEEYRQYAVTTLELARKQEAGADKNRLMALAEAWRDLAERAAKAPIERLRRLRSEAKDGPRPGAK